MVIDHIRDLDEFKKLFYDRPMNQDVYSLDFIINNPHTYCFYEDDKLIGVIFISKHTKRLFLSGFAVRRIPIKVVSAIKKVCSAFNVPMYSDTDKKEASLALRRAGFKRLRNTNIYKRSN